MSKENDDRKLRKIYSEIINGFSIHKYDCIDIYIKHFSSLDNLEIDYLYTEFYESAVKKGYPTEEERIQTLRKDGLWSDEKDAQLKYLRASLESLITAKRKAFILREIKSINQQIQETQDMWVKLSVEKDEIINSTAEKYAKRQVDAFFISKSFFRDRNLKNLLFSEKDFNEIDNLTINKLYEIHHYCSSELAEFNIKKIAIKDFFINIFNLAENVYQFFEKPIAELTYQQIQLCAYGNFFKGIMNGEPKPPNEIINDPDKLEDWYYGRHNADEALARLNKNGETGATLVGLTHEDREFLGLENPERLSGNTMRDKIRKAGGELSMNELMKLENV